MRKEFVAGQFYEDDEGGLREQILDCFSDGPGEIPGKKEVKRIYGAVAPHAGYIFSGRCQAHVYSELFHVDDDVFVLIGVNHRGSGNFISMEDWKTPLGVVEVNKEYCQKILEKCSFIHLGNEEHRYEHSIEVQLPFLQTIKNKFKVVPIILSDYSVYKELAKVLDKGVIIASSDFTHYGYSYGYVPFTSNVKDNMYKLDKKAIEYILKLDSEGFLKFVKDNNATICGYAAILVAIEVAKLKGAKEGKLLKYYTSGDLTNYDQAVGYAGIVFV